MSSLTAIKHRPTRPAPGPNFVPSPLVGRKLDEMRPKIAAVKRAMQNGRYDEEQA